MNRTRIIKVLAVAAVLWLPALLAAPHAAAAPKTDTTAYNYRACESFSSWDSWGWVCLKAIVARQADGQGTVVSQVHAYAFTGQSNTDPDYQRSGCPHAFEDDPAVVNMGVRVEAGSSLKWSRTSPNLVPATNACDALWTQLDVHSNALVTDVTLHFKARIDNGLDSTQTIGFRIAHTITIGDYWGCLDDTEDCQREAA